MDAVRGDMEGGRWLAVATPEKGTAGFQLRKVRTRHNSQVLSSSLEKRKKMLENMHLRGLVWK